MAIRVGIIGAGYGAQVHAPILQRHPDYEVSAITSLRPGRAETVATSLGIPNACNDWNSMINDIPLDLIVIASEPSLHMEMTIASLNAGLHVVCEKPPALSLSQVVAMKEVAEKKNGIFAMNFEWRYLPERQAIKRVLDDNTIGDIFHVNWTEAWPLWPRIKDDQNTWQWQVEKGGGMLGAVGSHMIDALQHWFGSFSKIQGFTTRHVFERQGESGLEPSTGDDSFYVNGTFENGGTFSLQFITAAIGQKPRVQIFGANGTLVLEGNSLSIATAENREFTPVEYHQSIDASSFPSNIRGYIHAQWMFYNDLARFIYGDARPSLPTIFDAIRVQAVMDEIRHSC